MGGSDWGMNVCAKSGHGQLTLHPQGKRKKTTTRKPQTHTHIHHTYTHTDTHMHTPHIHTINTHRQTTHTHTHTHLDTYTPHTNANTQIPLFVSLSHITHTQQHKHIHAIKKTLSRYIQVCKPLLPRPTNKPAVLQPSLPWTRGGLLFKDSSSFSDCGESCRTKSQKPSKGGQKGGRDKKKCRATKTCNEQTNGYRPCMCRKWLHPIKLNVFLFCVTTVKGKIPFYKVLNR